VVDDHAVTREQDECLRFEIGRPYIISAAGVAGLALEETAKAVNGKLVIVEDHWPEGGLGAAVLEALAAQPMNNLRVVKLAVKDMPGSGTPEELLHAAGIDADAIIEAVKSLL
jgi:transketolase